MSSLKLAVLVTLSLLLFSVKTRAETKKYDSADFWIRESNKIYLSYSEEWKLLLHYHGDTSSIKDDYFFLSKEGRTNPQSELDKTIEEFFRVDLPLDDNHPICRYPARLKFITKKLNIDLESLPKPNCSNFKTYLKNTSAQKVSIVFASENINNLMSMMGHIFIKISGNKHGKPVNHALGYFANFSQDNPISFVFNALFSGTSGVYLLEPYNKKLREYNDDQKRSIWEYELLLNQDRIDMLMLHIWELKRVNAKYNFITHNCGSALLYLLYVVDPSLQKIYSTTDAPIDIIKNLERINYIKSIELYPSDSYRFRMISDNLNSIDRKNILSFIKTGEEFLFNDYQPQQKSNILEATRIALDYKLINKNLDQKNYDLLRKKIEEINKPLPKNNLSLKVKNPLQKSDSSRFTFGYNNAGKNRNMVSFGFYPVYNSINDNNSEYFNEFELQLANIEGGYYTDRDIMRINNIDLIKMKNIIPYDSIVNGISGSFKMNFERERFDYKSNRMFPNINFGAGFSKNIFTESVIVYSMANAGYSYFRNKDITYANPEIGFIIKEGNFGKLNAKYTKFFSSDSYKYKNISSIDQSLFIKENDSFLLSYKIIDSDIIKSFHSLSLEFQHHF